MNIKLILILLLLGVAVAAFAETDIDAMIFSDQAEQDSIRKEIEGDVSNDIIRVNYQRKSPQLAMLLSSVFPGAGQFYADKSLLRTYVYPVIELGLIGGIIYFNSRGNDKTKDYERFANGETITQTFGDFVYTGPRYKREFQNSVQAVLMAYNTNDIYDGTFFRLDTNNSQHFYEDIGKYDKYVFGWADWYHVYAANSDGAFVLDQEDYFNAFKMSSTDQSATWLGNFSIADMDANNYSNPMQSGNINSSPMRKEYISMRRASEKEFQNAHLLSFGIMLNHVVSAIDAVIITNNVNRMAISQNKVKLNYYTRLYNQRLTPSLGLSWNF